MVRDHKVIKVAVKFILEVAVRSSMAVASKRDLVSLMGMAEMVMVAIITSKAHPSRETLTNSKAASLTKEQNIFE